MGVRKIEKLIIIKCDFHEEIKLNQIFKSQITTSTRNTLSRHKLNVRNLLMEPFTHPNRKSNLNTTLKNLKGAHPAPFSHHPLSS